MEPLFRTLPIPGAVLAVCLLSLAACSDPAPSSSVADVRGTPISEAPPDPMPEPGPILPSPAEVQPVVATDPSPDLEPEPDLAAQKPAVDVPRPELVKGVWRTGFEFLASFDYQILDFETDFDPEQDFKASEIPDEVRGLDGKVVRIEGHMVPIDYDHETQRVKRFILSRHLAGCCFGDVPRITENIDAWVQDPGGAKYESYRKILVTGVLSVGEQMDEGGSFTGVYRLDVHAVEVVPEE